MAQSELTPWKTARERRRRIATTAYWVARFRVAAEMLSPNPTPEETLRATSHTLQADELAAELAFLLGEPLPDVFEK